MIRETGSTIYITAGCFRDRYHHAQPLVPFSYATGELLAACKIDADARELRALVYEMEMLRKISRSERYRPDLARRGGTASFEYLATRLAPDGTR